MNLWKFIRRNGKYKESREKFSRLPRIKHAASQISALNVFTGGPPNAFPRVGRNQLIVLIDQGLTPDSKVLDIGCGCLRGGYWIISFLNKNNYFGIEPNVEMLEAGKKYLLDSQSHQKCPTFSNNDNFDLSVFNTQFDFVIARSIWSHASPAQIKKMLAEFCAVASQNSIFLTSYFETDKENQYDGDSWVGRSHETKEPGVVGYNFNWIRKECSKNNLKCSLLYEDYGQTWIKISPKDSENILKGEPLKGRIIPYIKTNQER